jgi:putative membrane protein
MRILITILLNALALWIVTLFKIGVHADTYTALVIAAIVLGIVNAVLRPIVLLLSLPFVIVTLGLFVFVVNGLLLLLVGAIVPGFHVDGFWSAVLGAVLLGIVSWAISLFGLTADSAKAE